MPFALSTPLQQPQSSPVLITTLSLTLPQNTGGRVQVLKFQLYTSMSKAVRVLPQVVRLSLLPLKPLVLPLLTKSLTLPQNTGGRAQVLKFQSYLLLSKDVPVLPQVARLSRLPLKSLVLPLATKSLTLPQNTGG